MIKIEFMQDEEGEEKLTIEGARSSVTLMRAIKDLAVALLIMTVEC